MIDRLPDKAFNLLMSKKPHLVILDAETTNPGDLSWNALSSITELQVHDRTGVEDVVARSVDADILMVNKVLLPREVLDALPRLKLVCLMSTGVNVVDLDACRERGIPVCNVPAYSTASVSELVLGLVLTWAREIERHDDAVASGAWAASPDFSFHVSPQRELAGRTLSIIGFGSIGQAVAKWGGALGMRVLIHTRNPSTKPQDLGDFVSLETAFRQADVLSLHCPLSAETEHLINKERLSWMKPDSLLVNTGRGGLVDENALAEALKSGRPGAAGLDVLCEEPPANDHPLISLPNCRVVPHIGWATHEARGRLVHTLEANVSGWIAGAPVNVVNGVQA